MRVRVITAFKDTKEMVQRLVGDEFILNKERFQEILDKCKDKGIEPAIEEVKEEVKSTKKAEK